MKAESEELLSLLVDGEPVDPDALAAALAEPGAADMLVQYARVDRAVANLGTRPSDRFYERMRRHLGARPQRTVSLRMPLAAAAIVLLSVTGGMWIGWSRLPARTVPVPLVLRTPAPPTTGDSARVVVPADCPAPGPPKPNRVVRLVPSENREPGAASAGGNRP